MQPAETLGVLQTASRTSAPGQRDESFGKSLRLRKRRDFLRAARQGGSSKTEHLKVQFRITRFAQGRVGLTVGKKVGNAVVRNRVKRRLREILRKDRALFAYGDVVVMALPPAKDASFETLKRDLYHCADKARDRASKLKNQKRRPRGRAKSANPSLPKRERAKPPHDGGKRPGG